MSLASLSHIVSLTGKSIPSFAWRDADIRLSNRNSIAQSKKFGTYCMIGILFRIYFKVLDGMERTREAEWLLMCVCACS